MRASRLVIVMAVVAAAGIAVALGVSAGVKVPAQCVNKKLCEENLRHGLEAFNRGRYSEAKAFFREAVKADPSSIKAWSFYDLSVMYDVAEQVKRAGKVKISSAPVPGSYSSQPAAAQPPAPPAPQQSSGGVIIEDEGC